MLKVQNNNISLGLGLLFLSFFLGAFLFDEYLLFLFPAVITMVLVVFHRPDLILLAIIIATPLSINLEDLGLGGSSLFVPTEPVLFGLTLLILFQQLIKPVIPARIIKHPVSVFIILYCFWLFVTSLTSVQPIVSFKFLVAKIWFFVPAFYFSAAYVLIEPKRLRSLLLCYMIPLTFVGLYTLYILSQNGFSENASHWAMDPFFRDHTQLGVVLALFIVICAGMILDKTASSVSRIFAGFSLVVYFVALLNTFSRAALLSLFVALGIWLIFWLRIRIWMLMVAGVFAGFFIVLSYDSLALQLQRNKTDSSDDLVENVESITNISTDASNLERINRWKSAYKMFKEKPLLGWGPGTYMFQYAPYQESRDLTIISTNFGDVGNAHSEYLGPLAESGFPGALMVLLLVGGVFYYGRQLYLKLKSGFLKHYTLFVMLALSTYFFHGILNNFLDTDKASVPVWFMVAILVAIDVYSRKDKIENRISGE